MSSPLERARQRIEELLDNAITHDNKMYLDGAAILNALEMPHTPENEKMVLAAIAIVCERRGIDLQVRRLSHDTQRPM